MVNIVQVSQSRGAPAFFWVTMSYVFIYFFFTDVLRKLHLKVCSGLKGYEVRKESRARLHEILTIVVIVMVIALTVTLVYLMFKFG